MPYQEIDTQDKCKKLLQQSSSFLQHFAFQSIDFTPYGQLLLDKQLDDCLFLGCKLTHSQHQHIENCSCMLFPTIEVPYNAFRNELYNAESLYQGYELGSPQSSQHTFDSQVYRHYLSKGKHATDIKETLARSLHDHAISNAMDNLLTEYDEKKVVAIMGGHGLLRTDTIFRKIIDTSKSLTEQGYLLVSGGGPGAMEATHLGAWMAGRSAKDVDEALALLGTAPSFKNDLWLETALQVMQKYPQTHYKSLGVPTWLYGHEPSTPFATHIAKYFENAIREDGILTIAKGGIIYAPGSAGTMQEIFQDAVQNHYLSFGYASPMVFLDKKYWTQVLPVYPLLESMLQKGVYKNLLISISDQTEEIIATIQRFTKA